MQHDDTNRRMTEEEWLAGLDREFSQVLAGTTRLEIAGFLLAAVFILTALLVYAS